LNSIKRSKALVFVLISKRNNFIVFFNKIDCLFIIIIITKMLVNMTKTTIQKLLEHQEIIEYEIIQLPNKEFLVNIQTPDNKNISTITDNWEELFDFISE